jgi:hypothetical protein
LGSGDFVSGYSYHMSVRTRLSDHTKQTKFQSQRPNDVETPVPYYFEYRSAATSGQSVLGWVTALSDIPIQGKMQIVAVGPRCSVVSHREEIIYTCVHTPKGGFWQSGTLANPSRPERVKTNKQTITIRVDELGTKIIKKMIYIHDRRSMIFLIC